MKWKKLGKIFDFYESNFKERFFGFCQSPQAIVFDDFVRIYFTTRKQDTNGKFISVPQYIDMDKEFKRIIDYSNDDIISVGRLGTFDEHGIFPFSPFRLNDKIYAYTTGWSRRVSVSCETGIGIVVSEDRGQNFTRIGDGPILTSSLYEPFLVCDGFVKKYNDIFYMWYIFGSEWKREYPDSQPERIYSITYAISNDGINFKKSNKKIIKNVMMDECQALPTVLKYNQVYHMIFCYRYVFNFRNNPQYAYRLGYAYSHNLVDWIRDDENCGIARSKEGWDSEMMCYPNLFECDGKIYLLYNGNSFGKYAFGLAILDE